MSTEYSISIDEWNFEDWEYIGRNIMYEYYEKHPKEAEDEGFELEDGKVKYLDELVDREMPMMLYAYPIYDTYTPEYEPEKFTKRVIEVCRSTNCTVVKKIDTDEYFLALTGGGMDLSQDIALAYIIIDSIIPDALANQVCTQYGLSVSGGHWFRVMVECKRALELQIGNYKEQVKKITESIKDQQKKKKVKVVN